VLLQRRLNVSNGPGVAVAGGWRRRPDLSETAVRPQAADGQDLAEEQHSHGRWAVSVFLGLALLEQVTLRRQPSYETAGGGEERC